MTTLNPHTCAVYDACTIRLCELGITCSHVGHLAQQPAAPDGYHYDGENGVLVKNTVGSTVGSPGAWYQRNLNRLEDEELREED